MPKKNEDDRRMTLYEVAEMADVCYATVWRAVKDGKLPARQRTAGGHYKVWESDARAWAGLDR